MSHRSRNEAKKYSFEELVKIGKEQSKKLGHNPFASIMDTFLNDNYFNADLRNTTLFFSDGSKRISLWAIMASKMTIERALLVHQNKLNTRSR